MNTREKIYTIGREFFQVMLITYLVLVVTETIRPGTVSNFFNLNWLLGAVLIFGLAMVIAEPQLVFRSIIGPKVTSVTKIAKHKQKHPLQ